MEKTIVKLTKNTYSLGRNGDIKTIAIDISLYEGSLRVIEISPITSKGLIGRCGIQIPIEDIQKIIDTLEKYKNA